MNEAINKAIRLEFEDFVEMFQINKYFIPCKVPQAVNTNGIARQQYQDHPRIAKPYGDTIQQILQFHRSATPLKKLLAINKIKRTVYRQYLEYAQANDCPKSINELIDMDLQLGVMCYCILKSGQANLQSDILMMEAFLDMDHFENSVHAYFYMVFKSALSFLENSFLDIVQHL